jgi:conjugative transfer signal peptidase TraF
VSTRWATIITTFTGAGLLIVSTIGEASPLYIWNASNSIPTGLYRVQLATTLSVTELVAIRPPDLLAVFLDLNGYLPIGVPMLKRVLALPGQTVCRNGVSISVDGIDVGQAQDRDRQGRPLPVWHGCQVIAEDDVFVMNWQSADSLDGRYFGPLPTSAVIGTAVPVWTSEE